MKSILILSLLLCTINLMAQPKIPFDKERDILLPEVIVVPEDSTFSVILRHLENDEFIVETDSIIPISRSFTYYDPHKKTLFLPTLTLGDESYKEVQLELVTHNTDSLRFRLVSMEVDKNSLKKVSATVETKPVLASGDAADDPAIWIHPINPAKSTIIGTQKQGGLGIYDLTGEEIQFLADGNMNNVDIRYNFPLGDENVAIVAASNRSNDSIALYKVNPKTRKLENVAARTISVSTKAVYGLCMYHSQTSGKYYVFINDKSGAVEQWEIFEKDDSGKIDASLTRQLKVKSQVEGCVADDELGHFYLGEERVGIWKFNAEPNGKEGHLIDTTKGNLTSEVEGLALYYINKTEGYLIASNQGNNTFTVHNRTGDNEYIGRFSIIADDVLGIDAVEDTDGIEVINVPLGKAFPYGVFIAQDGKNANPDENQNFKLVPWENIANALGLKMSQ